MEQMQHKHDVEKEKAMKDFDTYKLKVADMAQRTNRDYQGKFESQEEAITKMNSNFQDKITSFEKLNQELSTSLQKSKASSSMGIEALKNNYDKENNDLILKNDESYKEMLKEQLKIQGKELGITIFASIWMSLMV